MRAEGNSPFWLGERAGAVSDSWGQEPGCIRNWCARQRLVARSAKGQELAACDIA